MDLLSNDQAAISLIADEELVARYLAGEEKLLPILIERYLKLVYSVAYAYTKNADDSEDITQEVFVKVWKNLRTFDQQRKFKSWLLVVAKHTALDWLKKKKPTVFSALSAGLDFDFEDTLIDLEPDPWTAVLAQEEQQGTRDQVEKLPFDYRKVVSLKSEGYTFQEIAATLGRSINTVKSQYRRALLSLKKSLDKTSE